MARLFRLAVFVLALAGFPSVSGAQPSMSVSIGQGIESLGPAGESADSQGEFAGAASLGYSFAGERARIAYDVDMTNYASPGDWRSVGHSVSGRYRFDAGSQGRDRLFVGGDATFRRNGEAWDAANYDALGAFANFEARPARTATLRAGYRVDLRAFRDYTGLDHVEQGAFGSALMNFPSRTTLIAEVAAGAKRYRGTDASNPGVDVVPVDPATPPGGSDAWARGQSQGARLHASAWSALPPVTVGTPVSADGVPSSSAQILTVFVRVAQSLAARTGLTFDVSRRLTFGSVPPAVVSTPARFFDDGVYDDPFASDATDLRAGLTSFFPRDLELRVTGRYLDKPYGATPALDASGSAVDGMLRHDHVTRAAAYLTVPVAPEHTGAFDVSVVGGYDYTRHRSTTAAYNYTSNAVRVGFAVSY